MLFQELRGPCLIKLYKLGSKMIPQLEHHINFGHSNTSPSLPSVRKDPHSAVKRINVTGYDEFKNTIAKITDKQINVFFSGTKNYNGVSWCQQCVKAEPHVGIALQKFADKNTLFMYVEIGEKDYWKNIQNPFRLDKQINLRTIPTLLRWKSFLRLEGIQCQKIDLLELFFTENE